ncbi:MAG TPA: TrbI/VirB10 family protein [Hyphomonadaceae bacterium]|nr:TrbI/VirB10 family protein [Hyphomonadaceae bacterium]HPN05726.1 TrbI/VirB10 family protein [Hyphomonadaceae bacterium]
MVRDQLGTSATPRTGLDPTFDVDAPPRVAQSQSLWPVVFGLVGALALGVIVFLQLDANRASTENARLDREQAAKTAEAQRLAAEAAAAQPQPIMPAYVPVVPEPAPVELPVVEQQPLPPPVPAGPTQGELDRLRAPSLVVDLGEYKAPVAGAATGPNGQPLDPAAVAGAMSNAANQSTNADERFAQRLGVGSSSKPARASQLGDQANTIVEGTVIAAVLETALNSDLPGYVRAVVTRDVKGFDGSKVLVPRGSRLIGQYKSGVALGQSRTFVIWTRLIRPDGAAIELASPATDGLGRGGLDGDLNTHFWERFGGAILLTLLNIGGAAITDSSDTSIVIASTRAGVEAGSSSLTSGQNIGPTVTVPQGSPVRVFVSQDLDFSTVGAIKASAAN